MEGRLASVSGSLNHTYTYDRLGNFDAVVKGGITWDYKYRTGQPSRLDEVTGLGFKADSATGYDARGNLKKYTQGNTTYTLAYDVEGRLTSVKTESAGLAQTTTFFYDADGNRVLAVYNSGTAQETKVYTPFPDYEMEDPPSGANVTRTTYRVIGQIVAVQKRVGIAAGTFSYTYTDHLGNIVALSSKAGVLDTTSLTRYDPFGNFRTWLGNGL